jgi:hypothetical protein
MLHLNKNKQQQQNVKAMIMIKEIGLHRSARGKLEIGR